jgi:acetolactate synthase-1/3 small subunit
LANPSPAARCRREDGHRHDASAATNSTVIVRLAAFAEASAAERVRGPAKPWRRRDRTIQYAAADVFDLKRLRLLDTRLRGYDEIWVWRRQERQEIKMNQPASAYFMEERHDPVEAHTLSVLVQNEPGVLARVIGLFSGRGYNIESLTVSETENQKHVSRITIVTTGTPMVIEQIKHQLDRMVPVYRVVDMTLSGRSIERELAMVKLRGSGEHRVESLRLAEAFRARVIDATTESFVFEITGNSAKINQFIDLMRPLGLVEVSRTGVAAIGRGAEGM